MYINQAECFHDELYLEFFKFVHDMSGKFGFTLYCGWSSSSILCNSFYNFDEMRSFEGQKPPSISYGLSAVRIKHNEIFIGHLF